VEFQETVKNLRASGWKDWHILSMVSNIILNEHTNKQMAMIPEHEKPEIFHALVKNGMSTNPCADIFPKELFSETDIRNAMNRFMASSLKGYGFELHQVTPNFETISHFLSQRCNFWSDDIEHEDPFIP
jgi:hypothetical protein